MSTYINYKLGNLLLSLGFVLCLFSCQTPEKTSMEQASAKPNVLFIMSDDHTTQAFGVYGSRLASLNPTPVLDELGKQGMVFDQVFCNNSICTPSRASIMTGQYPQTNGVLDLDGSLPVEKQYLPTEMKKLGYQTAIIGKWHLKEEPAAFDHYEVLPVQGKYFDPEFRKQGEGSWPDNLVQYEGHSSDIITDLSIEWLKNQRKADQPFFLMHHYKAPHDDFEFAPRYADYLEDTQIPEPGSLYEQPDFGSEATRGKNDSLIHRIGTSVSNRHPYRSYVEQYEISNPETKEATSKAYQEYLKRYLRCVKGVDDNLGRLFDYLKENGLWENTIIIYTGDQGFMLGEHDYMDKRWMYDESMRMPFIMHYPPMIEAGSRSQAIINNTDFAPTMLALAGGEKPGYMQGNSFASVLEGNDEGFDQQSTYYRYWMHLMHHDVPANFGIRTKDYKLIFYYGLPSDMNTIGKKAMGWQDESYTIEQTPAAWEFYDLSKDPEELHNRYNDPAYQETIAKLKEQLRQKREALNETDENFPHIQEVIEAHLND
ncbi:arylsulfatase A-like enzyme [Catalinimonas alkaloidigena]|uniref:sulfatase family protein n=1 Tax=Catalinimonas alkaloidigena TaxID=1075417 RepID=UPI0024057D4A|nr:sulfatase [Catalinimonas alkaloidigena]MDF9796476.1 arylsulfatase A-like enzyme [Catalinimonas alkaloidigena]